MIPPPVTHGPYLSDKGFTYKWLYIHLFTLLCLLSNIGVARGCTGCTCTPQGGENFYGPNLQGKVVSVPLGTECTTPSPRGRAKVQFLANANSSSCSPYVIGRPSVVCLSSVTFVRPTQAIEIFGNISTPCGTLAIHDLCIKILRRSSQGNPSVGGVKHKREG